MVRILGIVNLTRDSFSDGGRYLDPAAALAHARRLLAEGADIIDLGAESTHPDSEEVSVAEELRRLTPVVEALLADGAQVSVDTVKPPVMRAMGELGVQFLNDVQGMRDPEAIAAAAESSAKVIVMFSRGAGRGGRAGRGELPVAGLLDEIRAFFAGRIAALQRGGVSPGRVILDPGMGFFLGGTPAPSLHVLRHLESLRELGLPLLVSTSRKSFLGTLVDEPADRRGPATLASELWAALAGADYLRTHEVRPLRQALAVLDAIRRA